MTILNEKVLLHDGQVFEIGGIKIECFLVPGHTWGHMVYLVDDKYLFTGDTIWFGADGGYSFISALAEDNKLAVRSLAALEEKLQYGSGYEARFFTCGICTLMKKLGLYDLTPAMCRLDYTMSEAGGTTNFVRAYTLASGGPYCDCGYQKKQS